MLRLSQIEETHHEIRAAQFSRQFLKWATGSPREETGAERGINPQQFGGGLIRPIRPEAQ